MSRTTDVEIGGYRVRILVDGGTGPVVVLSSGLGGRALHWADTVADLARDHTVVRFDRPGTPVTRRSGSPTVRDEADRIRGVLDAVGLAQGAVVVGHSVGGFYAEAFARLHPHRTRALLLLDSSIAADLGRLALPLRVKLVAAHMVALLLTELHLAQPLGRVGLALVQRRRPSGLDAQTVAEIRRAADDPVFVTELFAEYACYRQLAAQVCTLRARYALPPVRRMVVTAHTGWRTRRWRAQQIELAHTLGAEHVTVAPSGHLVMIEQPLRTAALIRNVACEP
ncbi:alpha/beta fold hydrolase [Mycobacterium sp. ML4]